MLSSSYNRAMPPTAAAMAQISSLVNRYDSLSAGDRRKLYRGNEQQTCNDFVIPLFAALGWETQAQGGNSQPDMLLQASAGKGRVDYAFRLRNVNKFLVEAKHLEEDMSRSEWADQAVNYAYNKAIRWTVLTNFTSLQVFNALREGPPSQHRVLNLTYKEFLPQIDRLWMLSKESFQVGALDTEARLSGGADAREPVEKKLAAVLWRSRQDLFHELAIRNPQMPSEEIDSLVQNLLNRLVFIRTAEDREIEDARLREALNRYKVGTLPSTLLDEVRKIFAHYAQRYDSNLFPLIGDAWSGAYVDDTRIVGIARSLYSPPGTNIEFDFSAISADALGQIYEQYLGSEVVRPQAASKPSLPGLGLPFTVTKREARRKRGVYYTPRFIVDYIVRHTVEELIYEDPSRLDDIRIADIACGSGSFLIRAYDVLLDLKGSTIGQQERLDILRRSIYGIDLDSHAIDVARLNLLIRALADPILLPMLQDNLVVRNSLIHGPADELRPFFGNDWGEKKRLDFAQTFPAVAKEGGFDVIIGNPPYVEIQTQDRREADYIKAHYSVSGNFDIYLPFIERALQLVRPGGRVGYIVPHKFMTNQYGQKLRTLLSDMGAVEEIVHFGDQQVFEGVTTYTSVLILRKNGGITSTRVVRPIGRDAAREPDRDRLADTVAGLDHGDVPPNCLIERGELPHPSGLGPWPLLLGGSAKLTERLASECAPLSATADRVFQGLITSADHIYHLRRTLLRSGSLGFQRFKRGPGEAPSALGLAHQIEPALMHPLLSGTDVGRYEIRRSNTVLLFPYHVANRVAKLIEQDEMRAKYPEAWRYLEVYEGQLRGREAKEREVNGQRIFTRPFDDDKWYRFGRSQSLGLHDQEKLAIPATVSRLSAAFDDNANYYLNNVRVGGALAVSRETYWWLLAMLNSKLLHFVFSQQENTFANGYFQANRQFIDPLPIPDMNAEPSLTTLIVALAKDMHALKELQRSAAPTDALALANLQAKFDDADREMDELVAQAYRLTPAERSLVGL